MVARNPLKDGGEPRGQAAGGRGGSVPSPSLSPLREGGERVQGSEEAAVFAILVHAQYRDRCGDCRRQRVSVARRLVRDGLTADAVARVWALARDVGKSPRALFAHWIDKGKVLVKLEELRVRGNRFTAKTREREVADLVTDLAMQKEAK